MKPKPVEYLGHPQLDAVALFVPELLGEVVISHEQRLVLAVRQCGIGERMFDAVDLGARFEQRTERQRDFIDERASRVFQSVLRQVAHGQPGRLDDQPAVRLVQPGQHAQQRRLAGAVRTGETDAVAGVHLPGDGVEQDALAERLGERGKLDQTSTAGTGSPRARAATDRMRGSRKGFVR